MKLAGGERYRSRFGINRLELNTCRIDCCGANTMSAVRIVLFREEDGTTPLREWMRGLRSQKAVGKCLAAIKALSLLGAELRRPHADYLSDGIYELRTHVQRVQYRLLYFFHGRDIVVMTHGIVKRGSEVPKIEIDNAIHRMKAFKANPRLHSDEEEFE